jgi:hypothetical protein
MPARIIHIVIHYTRQTQLHTPSSRFMPDANNRLNNVRLILVSSLLVTLALVLLCMQYTTVYKLAALRPSLSYITIERFLSALSANQITLDLLDFLWISLLVSILGALLFLEWKSSNLTVFLIRALATPRRAVFFFCACTLILVRYYFAPGHLSWAGDGSQHITYTEITRQILSQGELPIWTNALGAGSPYLQFYGFLFFYLSAAVAIIVNDFFSGLKITLALCHIVSGLGLYTLISYKTHSRRAGFFAGLVYVLCFWHAQQVLIMGRLPLSLFYALLPWPFYFLERALKTAHIRSILSAGLTLGLLALTHPGYGFWATVFFALYATLHVFTGRISLKRGGFIAGSTLALGLLAGAYLTLAMWLEKDYTGLNEGFELGGPKPSWWHLLIWSNFRFWLLPPTEAFHWYGGYLGISAAITALIGFACCVHWKRIDSISIWLPLLLCAFLIWGYDVKPLSEISFLRAFPPVRYLLFIVFFLSIAAGLGYHYIAIWARRACQPRVPTFVLLILLFDLGPTTFQHVYTIEDNFSLRSYMTDLMDEVLEKSAPPPSQSAHIPNYRLLWTTGSGHPSPFIFYPLFLTQIPNARTVHPGDLLSGKEFTNPFEILINDMLLRKEDSPSPSKAEEHFLLGGLRMLNVGASMSTLRDRRTIIHHFPNNPIIASHHLYPYSTKHSSKSTFNNSELHEDFRPLFVQLPANQIANYRSVIQIIENTKLDEQRNNCAQILVRNLEQPIQLPMQADVTLLHHEVSHSRVDLHFAASDSTFIRLAYSYYPYLSVRLNGKKVEPYETAGHFIALPVSKGTHHIELVAELSPLRRWLLGIHIGLWLLTAVTWIRKM